MSYRVEDVCNLMEKLAPLDLALEWDNVGLQIGHPQKEVGKVLITLTVTPEVVKRAVGEKVDLVISHHPLIFRPLQGIRKDQPTGALIWDLVQNDISLYVSHTNLDQAPLGLNQWLAEELHLEEIKILSSNPREEVGLGRVGRVAPQTLAQLKKKVEQVLGHPVRMVGEPEESIETVAVVGGSGGSFITEAKQAGAQVLITGDVSYHNAVDALNMGLCVLDGGHFGTERIMVGKLASYLRAHNLELDIIEETSANPFSF